MEMMTKSIERLDMNNVETLTTSNVSKLQAASVRLLLLFCLFYELMIGADWTIH
jgi:hypothetical protein